MNMSSSDSNDDFTFDYRASKNEFLNDSVEIPFEWRQYLCGIGKNLGDKVGDVVLFDYMPDVKVPCIVIDDRKYHSISRILRENSARINVNLNIFDDRQGSVFVEIIMNAPQISSTNHEKLDSHEMDFGQERFIINARSHFSFFEAMANSIMIGLLPPHMDALDEQVTVMIQFPRPDRILHSLDLIKKGLDKQNNQLR